MITVETYTKWRNLMSASFDRTDKYIQACTDEEEKASDPQLDSKVN